MIKVLFVCMGNICRSPTAHGVFRRLVEARGLGEHIETDSAGTHAYHVGNPPDERAQACALRRGYELSGLCARRVNETDFDYYDYILAMDRENLHNLKSICPGEHSGKLALFMRYAQDTDESEVPDPYYGGSRGFERVLDMIEAASEGLLTHLVREHLRRSS
jgi:protein-tyrosine phosphatase